MTNPSAVVNKQLKHLEDKSIGIPGPYAIICYENSFGEEGCGQVFLTGSQYHNQMRRPDRKWQCPICMAEARWDDKNKDKYDNA